MALSVLFNVKGLFLSNFEQVRPSQSAGQSAISRTCTAGKGPVQAGTDLQDQSKNSKTTQKNIKKLSDCCPALPRAQNATVSVIAFRAYWKSLSCQAIQCFPSLLESLPVPVACRWPQTGHCLHKLRAFLQLELSDCQKTCTAFP